MGPLLSQKDYKECLINFPLDHNKFGDMQQALSMKVVFDKLANDFELWFDFKATRSKVPMTSYSKVVELWEQAYDMVAARLPGPNTWKTIQHFGSIQLTPPQ